MKPKIAFLFVEAGLGHVMPMKAVLDVFEKKYKDNVDILKINFFSETNNVDMKFVENQLIEEVLKYNKRTIRAKFHFLLMKIVGTKKSLKYLVEKRYNRGLEPSLNFMKSLDVDLIFNTHFITGYYACKLKHQNLIKSDIVTYCPDPHIGKQWDRRNDLITLSSKVGKKQALKDGFKEQQVDVIPFLIRKEIVSYNKGKDFYREELGIPKNNFTVLLADGAYGAGKLKNTVLELLKTKKNITIIPVCGKNENLYKEFQNIKPNNNIVFKPFGFTDKMLLLAASCDLFIGKAGASNLAEPCYFMSPQIISFCASPVEDWICNHYVKSGSAIKCTNVKKIRKIVEEFIDGKNYNKYKEACVHGTKSDGPEQLADILYNRLMNKEK